MAELGAPKTTKFAIGTAEVRIGPLSMANRLTQAHSIGLLDQVQLQIQQDTNELQGGFPQRPVDSAITSETNQITATYREFSRQNLSVALGHGLSNSDERGNLDTTASASAKTDDTSLTVAAPGSGAFKAGDLVVVYGAGRPENVQVLRVKSVGSATTGDGSKLTLDENTPLIHDVAVGDPVYLAAPLPVGGLTTQQYFAVQVIRMERGSNKPIGWNFWKGAVSGGLDATFGGTDYASSDLQINLLQPAATEYGADGDLSHLANIVPSYPTGMRFAPSD